MSQELLSGIGTPKKSYGGPKSLLRAYALKNPFLSINRSSAAQAAVQARGPAAHIAN